MRISDIIGLARDYLWLGIIVAGVLGIGYISWYYLFFKRKWPDKKLNKGKVICWGSFVIYLVVILGATMLSRGGFYGNTRIYPLFYSYKDAWTDFSIAEWRNIILNFGMFVPLGFLLPQLIKKTDSVWKVLIIGFLFTFSIEMLQLLLKRGVFEPDDLLGNTVGAVIGYGLYYLVTYLMKRRKKKELPEVWKVLLHQIPLFVTVGMFSAIFLIYHTKELGNMPDTCISKQKNIEVSSELEFSKKTEEMMVYKSVVMEVDETREMARNIFEKLGDQIDESRTDIYENTALYYSMGDINRGNRYSLWIEYDGGVFRFTDFEKSFNNGDGIQPKEMASEEEVKAALEQLGVRVPAGAVFKEEERGEYTFFANRLEMDGNMYDGYIRCTYYEDEMLGNVYYEMFVLDEYNCIEIISEAQAYEEIEQGYFNYFRADENTLNVEITGVDTGYELDTKGFYQPVYVFDGKVNGNETQIIVPAIK